MSRLIEPAQAGAKLATSSDDPNGVERIAKYIPAEILAFYTMWTQAATMLPIETTDISEEPSVGILFPENTVTIACAGGLMFGVIITFFYFDRFFPNAKPVSRKYHRAISPIAFVIYGYTIWGAVDTTYFVPGIALMATAVLTLVSFLAQPKAPIEPAG